MTTIPHSTRKTDKMLVQKPKTTNYIGNAVFVRNKNVSHNNTEENNKHNTYSIISNHYITYHSTLY